MSITDLQAEALLGGLDDELAEALRPLAGALASLRHELRSTTPGPSAELTAIFAGGPVPLAGDPEPAHRFRRWASALAGLSLGAKVFLGAGAAVAAVGLAHHERLLGQPIDHIFDRFGQSPSVGPGHPQPRPTPVVPSPSASRVGQPTRTSYPTPTQSATPQATPPATHHPESTQAPTPTQHATPNATEQPTRDQGDDSDSHGSGSDDPSSGHSGGGSDDPTSGPSGGSGGEGSDDGGLGGTDSDHAATPTPTSEPGDDPGDHGGDGGDGGSDGSGGGGGAGGADD